MRETRYCTTPGPACNCRSANNLRMIDPSRSSSGGATATAGESTYAGIVKLVAAAQTAKAPFIRLADRFALLLFPVALLVAGGAWFISGDPIRGLAVLVAATPCPLILAAPVAFIAGVAQAAGNKVGVNAKRPGGPDVGPIRAAMAKAATRATPENAPSMMKKGGKAKGC